MPEKDAFSEPTYRPGFHGNVFPLGTRVILIGMRMEGYSRRHGKGAIIQNVDAIIYWYGERLYDIHLEGDGSMMTQVRARNLWPASEEGWLKPTDPYQFGPFNRALKNVTNPSIRNGQLEKWKYEGRKVPNELLWMTREHRYLHQRSADGSLSPGAVWHWFQKENYRFENWSQLLTFLEEQCEYPWFQVVWSHHTAWKISDEEEPMKQDYESIVHYACDYEFPIRFRCIYGESEDFPVPTSLTWGMERAPFKSTHGRYLYHGSNDESDMQTILREGIKPTKRTRPPRQGNRSRAGMHESLFMAALPSEWNDHKLRSRTWEEFMKCELMPCRTVENSFRYYFVVDVCKAEMAGVEFHQTLSLEVLSQHDIPGNCILQVLGSEDWARKKAYIKWPRSHLQMGIDVMDQNSPNTSGRPFHAERVVPADPAHRVPGKDASIMVPGQPGKTLTKEEAENLAKKHVSEVRESGITGVAAAIALAGDERMKPAQPQPSTPPDCEALEMVATGSQEQSVVRSDRRFPVPNPQFNPKTDQPSTPPGQPSERDIEFATRPYGPGYADQLPPNRVPGRDASLPVEAEVQVGNRVLGRDAPPARRRLDWADVPDERLLEEQPPAPPERLEITQALASIQTSCENCEVRISNAVTNCDHCGAQREVDKQKSWSGKGEFPATSKRAGGAEEKSRGLRKEKRPRKILAYNKRAKQYTRQQRDLDLNNARDRKALEDELFCKDPACPVAKDLEEWMTSDWPDHQRTFGIWYGSMNVECTDDLKGMIEWAKTVDRPAIPLPEGYRHARFQDQIRIRQTGITRGAEDQTERGTLTNFMASRAKAIRKEKLQESRDWVKKHTWKNPRLEQAKRIRTNPSQSSDQPMENASGAVLQSVVEEAPEDTGNQPAYPEGTHSSASGMPQDQPMPTVDDPPACPEGPQPSPPDMEMETVSTLPQSMPVDPPACPEGPQPSATDMEEMMLSPPELLQRIPLSHQATVGNAGWFESAIGANPIQDQEPCKFRCQYRANEVQCGERCFFASDHGGETELHLCKRHFKLLMKGLHPESAKKKEDEEEERDGSRGSQSRQSDVPPQPRDVGSGSGSTASNAATFAACDGVCRIKRADNQQPCGGPCKRQKNHGDDHRCEYHPIEIEVPIYEVPQFRFGLPLPPLPDPLQTPSVTTFRFGETDGEHSVSSTVNMPQVLQHRQLWDVPPMEQSARVPGMDAASPAADPPVEEPPRVLEEDANVPTVSNQRAKSEKRGTKMPRKRPDHIPADEWQEMSKADRDRAASLEASTSPNAIPPHIMEGAEAVSEAANSLSKGGQVWYGATSPHPKPAPPERPPVKPPKPPPRIAPMDLQTPAERPEDTTHPVAEAEVMQPPSEVYQATEDSAPVVRLDHAFPNRRDWAQDPPQWPTPLTARPAVDTASDQPILEGENRRSTEASDWRLKDRYTKSEPSPPRENSVAQSESSAAPRVPGRDAASASSTDVVSPDMPRQRVAPPLRPYQADSTVTPIAAQPAPPVVLQQAAPFEALYSQPLYPRQGREPLHVPGMYGDDEERREEDEQDRRRREPHTLGTSANPAWPHRWNPDSEKLAVRCWKCGSRLDKFGNCPADPRCPIGTKQQQGTHHWELEETKGKGKGSSSHRGDPRLEPVPPWIWANMSERDRQQHEEIARARRMDRRSRTPCWHYPKTGLAGCSFGNRCLYLHDPAAKAPAEAKRRPHFGPQQPIRLVAEPKAADWASWQPSSSKGGTKR